jgi:replicative DNA helicase
MIYSPEEIEQAFIGSLIVENNNIIMAWDIVTPDDMTTKQARIAYGAIQGMFKAKKPINTQSFLLEPELKDHFSWLMAAEDSGISSNCLRFAEQIAEAARLKRLAEKVKRLQNFNGQSSEAVLDDIKKVYTSELKGGTEQGDMSACFADFEERVKENMDGGCLGIPTGFDSFAQLDVDYEPGHCWAYGGYTNVGKTALMVEQILRVFRNGGTIPKIAIHSTEMKRHQILARLLAGMTGIGHKLILRGKQDHNLNQAKEFIFNSGLKIYDVNRDFDVFANQCRKDKLQGGLDLVFADYIQNFKRKGLKGYDLMSELGKDSLALPQELDLTLIMLSQISTSEFKEDSGGLAFKGAGELGESCDIGLWLSKCKSRENTMLVEHRKNRHGAKKDFLLEFAPHSNRLNEI